MNAVRLHRSTDSFCIAMAEDIGIWQQYDLHALLTQNIS